jgi:putative colanic acid biosynthesis UDP-glucose lipid carrier transferase
MQFENQNYSYVKEIAIDGGSDAGAPARPWKIAYRAIAPAVMLCDALLIVIVGTLSGAGYHTAIFGAVGDTLAHAAYAAVVAALFVSFAKSRDLYEPAGLLNLKSQLWRVTTKWLAVFLFLIAVAFAMKVGGTVSRGATLVFAAAGLIVLLIERMFWRAYLADGLAIRRFAGREVILITEDVGGDQNHMLQTLTRHGMKIAGHFMLPAGPGNDRLRSDLVAEAVASARGSQVEEIVIGADVSDWTRLTALASELRALPLPVKLVPLGASADAFRLPVHAIGDTVTIELQHAPLSLVQRGLKRAFDIVFALAGLLLLLPLLLATAAAIRWDSPGAVLFRQRRCGFNGRLFGIFKFRTMTVQEDGATVAQATRDDDRITRVGKHLRRTSIDELPQLINVLQGSMSIVGPRPHALAHDTQFDKLVRNYAFRHHVKPGITGWAQAHGYRGETRTVEDIEQRVKLDLWYIDNWSLALDVRIILMTVSEVLRGKNAY